MTLYYGSSLTRQRCSILFTSSFMHAFCRTRCEPKRLKRNLFFLSQDTLPGRDEGQTTGKKHERQRKHDKSKIILSAQQERHQ